MASITIRQLDHDLKHRLRLRAARNGRSMEEEARIILGDAAALQVKAGAARDQAAAPDRDDATDDAEITRLTSKLSGKAAPGPAKDKLNVKDLALTKDASDVDYKTLVEQLGFKSKANVKSVCAELSANLKAQGWTKQGSDLITPASAILKRKRGDAELTIFVKPESGGSEVKMMTESLAWDEK